MNSNRENEEYYVQLENGIAEMETKIELLRMEIYELIEMKDALNHLNRLLKKEVKEQIEDFLF